MYAKRSQMSKSQQILDLYTSIMQPNSSHKYNKSDNDVRKKLGAILNKYESPYKNTINKRRLNSNQSTRPILVSPTVQKKSTKPYWDSDEEPSKQRCRMVYSINSSIQLPNSNSTQQYQTTTATELRGGDDNLKGLLKRTKQLLSEYKRKLQKAEDEKKQLQLEVQYWKQKFNS